MLNIADHALALTLQLRATPFQSLIQFVEPILDLLHVRRDEGRVLVIALLLV